MTTSKNTAQSASSEKTPPVHRSVVVGITGASGSIIGFRLVEELLRLHVPVELVFSNKALPVIFEEMNLSLNTGDTKVNETIVSFLKLPLDRAPLLKIWNNQNLGASPSSGTHLTQGMVVVPCSMGTLAKIANGTSDNLVCRAADVTLKESRKLILVPRETPFNAIHLKNMLTLSQLGVAMIPPMLSFYLPDFNSIDGQINYTVGKVLDQLGLTHDLHTRWGEQRKQLETTS